MDDREKEMSRYRAELRKCPTLQDSFSTQFRGDEKIHDDDKTDGIVDPAEP